MGKPSLAAEYIELAIHTGGGGGEEAMLGCGGGIIEIIM